MSQYPHYIVTEQTPAPSPELLFWSNDEGWSEFLDLATVFTHAETKVLNLPLASTMRGNVQWQPVRLQRPTGECRHCMQSLYADGLAELVAIDEGDVCGVEGDNHPHAVLEQ